MIEIDDASKNEDMVRFVEKLMQVNLVDVVVDHPWLLEKVGIDPKILGALSGLTKPQLAASDWNTYARPATRPLISWSPVDGEKNELEFKSLADFRALYSQFEANSRVLASEAGVLRSVELKNLRPVNLTPVASPLPAEVAAALGWAASGNRLPGAYQ